MTFLCVLFFVPWGIAQDLSVPPTLPSVVASRGDVATTTSAGLGDSITVAMEGLEDLTKSGKSTADLRLYLAGHILESNGPTLVSLRDGYANFQLDLHPEDRDAWVRILYEARRTAKGRIPMTVGHKDFRQPFASSADLNLRVFPTYSPFIGGLVLAMFASIMLLGYKSDLLRDTTNPPPAPARAPYSFGRVQMAFWFGLVIIGFSYVWLITGEYNTVTNSVLALIGISAGTGLAAAFVDRQKVENAQPGVSAGLVKDLLSSGEGVTFHRFQMAVWTIVFGIIFVRSIYRDLTMPDFDTTLLGLMGLSSGTYIGFKFPEKSK